MEPSWNSGLRVAGDGAWGGGAASAACLGVCACCSEELRAPNCAISGVKKGLSKKKSAVFFPWWVEGCACGVPSGPAAVDASVILASVGSGEV